jgi:hypothetical protein
MCLTAVQSVCNKSFRELVLHAACWVKKRGVKKQTEQEVVILASCLC